MFWKDRSCVEEQEGIREKRGARGVGKKRKERKEQGKWRAGKCSEYEKKKGKRDIKREEVKEKGGRGNGRRKMGRKARGERGKGGRKGRTNEGMKGRGVRNQTDMETEGEEKKRMGRGIGRSGGRR